MTTENTCSVSCKERVVLGLDLGVASIGWSLVRLYETPFEDSLAIQNKSRLRIADYAILDMGVRSFAKSENYKSKSLACVRGEARRARRTLSRRKHRKKQVYYLLQKYGFVPKMHSNKEFADYIFVNTPQHPTPWTLRAKALDQKLTAEEFCKVIYHIIAHRGFYFTSKSDDGKASDAGKVKKSIANLEMQWSGYRTIGAFLADQPFQRNHLKKGKTKEREYHYCIKREWLQEELALILQTQRQLGHALDDAFMKCADEFLMRQKGYDAESILKMWGKCPVYKEERRAPKQSATAEYFVILNHVNNLRLVTTQKEHIPLSGEECEKVIQKIYANKGEMSFSQLRKILGETAQNKTFNLCNYTQKEEKKATKQKENTTSSLGTEPNNAEQKTKNPESSKFIAELKGTKTFANAFKMNWNDMYLQRSFLDDIAKVLAEQKEDAKRLEGFSEVEKKHAIHISDEEKDILLAASFKGTATYGITALRTLIPYMEPQQGQGFMHHQAVKEAIKKNELPDFLHPEYDTQQEYIPPYEGDFSHNPIVSRVFSQCRKLINALQKKHGHIIDAVHIEVGTDLGNGPKNRRRIQDGQKQFRDKKELAVERLKSCGMTINSANILKMRLYIEQAGICPYTGSSIALEYGVHGVHFDTCQVDHILPFSRTFNNSMNNKVLVTAQANQEKGNRIPREWLQEKQWDAFAQRITDLMPKLSWNKKRTLLRQTLTAEDREAFISRNLNDTRYASRAVADYLRQYFRFSTARQDINPLSRVQVVSGGITALLRYSWGLDKNRDIDDKHHAVDATVLACATRGHVFCLSTLAKHYEKHVKYHFNDVFEKEHRLRRDLEARLPSMVVSRMERHTITGSAHKEGICTINEETAQTAGRIFFINRGWAKRGTMVRADIFCDIAPQKRKKIQWYIVPLYTQDFLQESLPSKAIVNKKPYKDWIDVSDTNKYRFCFSLFKDDLVSLTVAGQPEPMFYYINFIQGTRAEVTVNPFAKPSGYSGPPSTLTINKGIWKKYRVDILGNVHKVRKEIRVGTRKELRSIKQQRKG